MADTIRAGWSAGPYSSMNKYFSSFFLLGFTILFSSCATTPSPRAWNEVTQRIGPVEYVALMDACDLLKMNYEWDALTKKHILYKNSNYLSFMTNDRNISINGNIRTLSVPPRVVNGVLMLPRELAEMPWWKQKENFWKEVKAVYPGSSFMVDKVVIDAGHGGKDRGAPGLFGLDEKNIVLEIAKKLEQKLRAMGIDTVMTRTDDTYLTLPERAWVANNSGADLFVSIHANSAPDRSVQGTEIYYLSETVDDDERANQMVIDYGNTVEVNPDLPNKRSGDPTLWDIINTENRQESIELARAINSSLKRYASIKSRGIKSAGFFVLKWTDKPAILVETGFVTNRQEVRQLADPAYQDQLAGLIAEGIMAYKAEYERTRGFTTK